MANDLPSWCPSVIKSYLVTGATQPFVVMYVYKYYKKSKLWDIKIVLQNLSWKDFIWNYKRDIKKSTIFLNCLQHWYLAHPAIRLSQQQIVSEKLNLRETFSRIWLDCLSA